MSIILSQYHLRQRSYKGTPWIRYKRTPENSPIPQHLAIATRDSQPASRDLHPYLATRNPHLATCNRISRLATRISRPHFRQSPSDLHIFVIDPQASTHDLQIGTRNLQIGTRNPQMVTLTRRPADPQNSHSPYTVRFLEGYQDDFLNSN